MGHGGPQEKHVGEMKRGVSRDGAFVSISRGAEVATA